MNLTFLAGDKESPINIGEWEDVVSIPQKNEIVVIETVKTEFWVVETVEWWFRGSLETGEGSYNAIVWLAPKSKEEVPSSMRKFRPNSISHLSQNPFFKPVPKKELQSGCASSNREGNRV